MEKDCHNGARQQSKSMIELLAQRTASEHRVDLERTLFEVASDRARTGAPLEEETEKRQGARIYAEAGAAVTSTSTTLSIAAPRRR